MISVEIINNKINITSKNVDLSTDTRRYSAQNELIAKKYFDISTS
jgi:hypothetical protein